VAVLTGYAATSGGFNNYLGALRSRGLMEGDGDRLTINEAGTRALGSWEPLPTGSDLVDYWRNRLGKAERLIVETFRTSAYSMTTTGGMSQGPPESSSKSSFCKGAVNAIVAPAVEIRIGTGSSTS
jgi:uncharacterized protein